MTLTLEEIRKSDRVLLRPADVAPVLGVHPYAICLKARDGSLEFPYLRIGNRTKIPRVPFLEWLEGNDWRCSHGHEEV